MDVAELYWRNLAMNYFNEIHGYVADSFVRFQEVNRLLFAEKEVGMARLTISVDTKLQIRT